MKTFKTEIGNTEVRAGHRKGCAQLRAILTVTAKDKDQALAKLRKLKKAKKAVVGGVDVELVFNTESLTLKDIKEV
jgi:hypothetical protein